MPLMVESTSNLLRNILATVVESWINFSSYIDANVNANI